jgi:ABC-2 type transport system ATP-binding protein
MQETASGIAIQDVVKSYKRGKVKALNGVSLQIEQGEAFGIIGPNGAGKTTLFGCLLGFLHTDSGKITVDGLPPDYLATRRRVGYLPERLDFDRWMTGYDFMTFHYELLQLPNSGMKAEVEKLLTMVGLDSAGWTRPLGKYSRGMLQRLGLAQALIGGPKFLFLDEPASGVDPGGVLLFRKILRQVNREGVTILLNSHQLDQVERICSRVAFVKGGKIEAVETVGETTGGVQYVLVIKFKSGSDADQRETFKTIATDQDVAPLIDSADDVFRFSVTSDEQTAELVKVLSARDLPIVHVSREEQSLERLFHEGQKLEGGLS